jgi:ABC-type Fe3+-hydroxamate transport system substrate-binding protein
MVTADASCSRLDVTPPHRHPVRIVSLVPSTTETLFELGAGDRVVGVTRFCVHPQEAREKAQVVGGTKNPSVPKTLALRPDLILANQEENRREDIERLRESTDVFLAFPRSVSDACSDILTVGGLVGEEERASALVREIEAALREVRSQARAFRYLYLIWRKPYMVAGPGTFVDALLAEAGGIDAAPTGRGRYPEMSIEEIAATEADVLFLSSEPFPFRERHRQELLGAFPERRSDDRVLLVDGELLSWHGARLREGIPYLGALGGRIDEMLRSA